MWGHLAPLRGRSLRDVIHPTYVGQGSCLNIDCAAECCKGNHLAILTSCYPASDTRQVSTCVFMIGQHYDLGFYVHALSAAGIARTIA
jgi:hypothetical protein